MFYRCVAGCARGRQIRASTSGLVAVACHFTAGAASVFVRGGTAGCFRMRRGEWRLPVGFAGVVIAVGLVFFLLEILNLAVAHGVQDHAGLLFAQVHLAELLAVYL